MSEYRVVRTDMFGTFKCFDSTEAIIHWTTTHCWPVRAIGACFVFGCVICAIGLALAFGK